MGYRVYIYTNNNKKKNNNNNNGYKDPDEWNMIFYGKLTLIKWPWFDHDTCNQRMPKDLILKRQLSLPGAIKALPGGSRVTGLGPVGADAADQERWLIMSSWVGWHVR